MAVITHFSQLKLQTVSIQGVKQVYGERLGIPIAFQTDTIISFAVTPYTTLSFEEVDEPISPAHFAFQVPYSRFHESARWVQQSGLLVVKWEEGQEIYEEGSLIKLYFRDGDGNLLEIIAHRYVDEQILSPCTPLNILYMREVGFPVDSVPVFREWLKSYLGMATSQDGTIFNFVIGGTAHIVANWRKRPWIPIAMKALPPNMHVTLGTPSLPFLRDLEHKLRQHEIPCDFANDKLSFVAHGYAFTIAYTPGFASDIPKQLKLPLSLNP